MLCHSMRRTAAEAGSIPFDPLTLNPLVWYDFSDSSLLFTDAGSTNVTTDGDLIYQANDKSVNGYNATQSNSGARPVYKTGIKNGESIARFDGLADCFSLPCTNVASDYTFFAVVKSTSQVSYLFDTASGRFVLALNLSAGIWFDNLWRGSQVSGGSTWKLMVFKPVSTGGNYYEDGATIQSSIGYSKRAIGGNTVIGAHNNQAATFLEADIGEFIIYPTALSDSDRGDVGGFLNNKWGIY